MVMIPNPKINPIHAKKRRHFCILSSPLLCSGFTAIPVIPVIPIPMYGIPSVYMVENNQIYCILS